MVIKRANVLSLSDIASIFVIYAPRGMGSQMDVIVGYLFATYYGSLRIPSSYRSTICKILHHQCGWPPDIYLHYRSDIAVIHHDVQATLSRYPGVARRCMIRDQIAALVDASPIDTASKHQLQLHYDPDNADLDTICTYISGVISYIIRNPATKDA